MMRSNPEAKEQLRAFLSFYKENRELISALAGSAFPSPPQAPAEQKERRSEESGAKDVLEEYLKRCG